MIIIVLYTNKFIIFPFCLIIIYYTFNFQRTGNGQLFATFSIIKNARIRFYFYKFLFTLQTHWLVLNEQKLVWE